MSCQRFQHGARVLVRKHTFRKYATIHNIQRYSSTAGASKVSKDIHNFRHRHAVATAHLPLHGISLRYLQDFADLHNINNDTTTQQVCDHIVKPLTVTETQERCSFASQLLQCEELNVHVQQKADRFVSHVWEYPFRDLLATLEEHRKEQNLDDLYCWIDVFVMNQHVVEEIGAFSLEWFTSTFQYGIQSIGHTVCVIHSHEQPVLLKRVWCIWELYCTLRQNAQLTICLEPKDNERLLQRVIRGDQYIGSKLLDVCILDAKTSNRDVQISLMSMIINLQGESFQELFNPVVAAFIRTKRIEAIQRLLSKCKTELT